MVTQARAILRWGSDRSVPGAVAASALAVLVLIGGPLLLEQRPTHRFLAWNLVLAWVPFVAGLVLELLDRGRLHRHRLLTAVTASVWLLFLPNAAYLVSDITHFNNVSPTPWLDLARLVAFAWAGCVLAVLSVRSVQRIVTAHVGTVAGWGTVILATGLSGVGVALGRFGRVNSWDVVTRPGAVVTQAATLAVSEQAIALAGFFSLLLLVVYVTMATRADAG